VSAKWDAVAIITGLAAIISAVGGVLLTIRAVRNRERLSYKKELDTIEQMLETERHERVVAEVHNYKLRLELAEHGITPPQDEEEEYDHEQERRQKQIPMKEQKQRPRIFRRRRQQNESD